LWYKGGIKIANTKKNLFRVVGHLWRPKDGPNFYSKSPCLTWKRELWKIGSPLGKNVRNGFGFQGVI